MDNDVINRIDKLNNLNFVGFNGDGVYLTAINEIDTLPSSGTTSAIK